MVVLDEGHDCSPVRLRAFLDMCDSCPKVIAYDENQSIYKSAQHSVRTIKSIAATHYFHLSTTFRFGSAAAGVASNFVARYHRRPAFCMTAIESRTTDVCVLETDEVVREVLAQQRVLSVLAPTHLSLLRCAYKVLNSQGVNFGMVKFGAGSPFHFVHASDGTRIMHQLLEFKHHGRADHPVLKAFVGFGKGYDDFAAWIHENGSPVPGDNINWQSAIKFIKEIGDEANLIVSRLALCSGTASLGGASFVFTTIHASKGLEYDWVHVIDTGLLPPWHISIEEAARRSIGRDGRVFANDSIEDLRHLIVAACKGDAEWVSQKLNLMYVALTRATQRLVLCEDVAMWVRPLGVRLSKFTDPEHEPGVAVCSRPFG